MRNFFEYLVKTILVLAMIDIIILFCSLLQLRLEGRSGEWNRFWGVQVEFINNLIN